MCMCVGGYICVWVEWGICLYVCMFVSVNVLILLVRLQFGCKKKERKKKIKERVLKCTSIVFLVILFSNSSSS